MVIDTLCITLIIFAIVNEIIGLYYFSKQEYNRFSVSFLLDKVTLNLIKSKGINQKNYKKIKFILNIRTILIILLVVVAAIYTVFKPANSSYIYILFIPFIIIKFISNERIKNLL
ncbi:hypothetical protein LGL55_18875 [Clostridium tagluense]|uniref:hypothetical protein n=1 Tax=Clostridium tagluense TaxID=360422 RepID=UPI001C0CFBBA|nr:hypothetical protein [Clostridium tagluense]MBU3130005.1 hypothetical protein [Clostridium tagluense]MCB2311879.1 hypothetical protein [Clostridium tagluense]MCB2317366.1 hypothetical protein [Clostridium tagluense]MCB2322842.1 hypothetical protein [Clostridium tagluense]MCB2326920.1 hypothetical protein [Clostridium tagluense]